MNSYWLSSTKNFNPKNKIEHNLYADVCVIGAGICGLSTAYYLTKSGLKVVVVDKSEIGEKTSGHTTAKITSRHGLIYDYLIKTYGIEFALDYFKANECAISNIKSIIDTEKIDCDFEYKDNYIFSYNKNDLDKLTSEVEALNLIYSYIYGSKTEDVSHFAKLVYNCELPFDIVGAIKTNGQAQFHPLKYMNGLADCIEKYGGNIFTNCLVQDVNKMEDVFGVEVQSLRDDESYIITSKYVVLASHYPFINLPGFYFSKMYQASSYAIALETDESFPDDMYITASEPTLSFRTVKCQDKRLLLVGGGNHKTGFSPDSNSFYGYSFLENEIDKMFENYNILYKWDTRDCITLDKIPYIGEFSSFMPNMFVATGFNKWGMTSSNVSANIIAGKIFSRENFSEQDDLIKFSNKFSYVFDSTRVHPIKNIGEVKNMAIQTFHSFVGSRLKIPKENLDKIRNDNGGIIYFDGHTVGVYKDADGKVYAVDPTCTHLGCLLTWNNVDKTWDCPCHGSRFDYTGKNLYDPAFKDLTSFAL